ncbi:hypothetical protein RhiirA1_476804 [Rhizophagus irregularis]|uniref:MULE transposase domain-containing protein n=1 Tax=Rhizophagus irregularis TaxID=588596 RepID=A0A2N0QUH8_9GLOM|nr:hypothetical protein RhiirA1_476804 [Rhizophagus irregularis]
MLLFLLKQQKDDPDYVIIPQLEGPANELTRLFWMTSYQSFSLFVAVDNNYKTRIVAQALIKYENQADFNWILQYTLSNLSVGLPLTYNTIFKELDSVLQANLLPISLSIQRAQINQSLLYQVNLVSINQVED